MSRRGSNDCLTPRPNTLKAHPMKAHVAPCSSFLRRLPRTFTVPVEKYLGRSTRVRFRVFHAISRFLSILSVKRSRRKVIRSY